MAEWQVGKLEDPPGAVRAPGERAVERCIRRAANRDPPGGEAPRIVIDILNRSVQRSQPVVGIVGEPERLAGARIMVLVYPGETGSDRVGIPKILILGVDADIGKGIGARAGNPQRDDL